MAREFCLRKIIPKIYIVETNLRSSPQIAGRNNLKVLISNDIRCVFNNVEIQSIIRQVHSIDSVENQFHFIIT